MKVVIVGGVAGGASAAARLRRRDEKACIVLIERSPYISYANCGLPYYIGGTIEDEQELLLQTPQSMSRRFAIDVRVNSEATAINRNHKTLTITNHATGQTYEESYDKLILSPGASPLLPDIAGITHKNIFTLRTVGDTQRIHAYIQEHHPRSAVVIGAGFIGLEMAENLVHKGLDVTIIQATNHVLTPLDDDMAAHVHPYIREQGIDLRLNEKASAISQTGDGSLNITLFSGRTIQADIILLAIGVTPDSSLAQNAGLKTNTKGAIVVSPRMLTSDPDIYAVGDAVEVTDFVLGRPCHVPLAGPANKQGRIVADHITGRDVSFHGTQGSSVIKIFDMTVATTGLNEQTSKAAGIDYDSILLFPASHASYYPGATSIAMKVVFEKKTGRILGAQLVGFEGVDKRCDVLATAIRAGMTASDLAELELCYAPPFSSAKDPVNMAGFMIENILDGDVQQFHWTDVEGLQRNPDVTLLDVRTSMEHISGSIPGAIHIPLDSLRSHLQELDKTKPVYVHCYSGQRSYLACRILSQAGFTAYNLAGGYKQYAAVMEDRARSLPAS